MLSFFARYQKLKKGGGKSKQRAIQPIQDRKEGEGEREKRQGRICVWARLPTTTTTVTATTNPQQLPPPVAPQKQDIGFAR
jgi:hypothetical protein